MKVIKIKTDGTYQVLDIPEINLDWLQEQVNGRIESITLDGISGFYIDEEGKLKDKSKNDLATKWWANCLEKNFDYLLQDFVVGDVILVGIDKDGESVQLEDKQIKEFEEFANGEKV